MSKTARTRKRNEKMIRKRQEKAARKALYASLAGTSRKAKRQGRKSALAGTYKGAHVMVDCGNPGCAKCYPKTSVLIHNRGGNPRRKKVAA